MKITIYNFKGGVGKTSIALNLALTLNFGVVTNDVYSPLETVLPEERFIKVSHDQEMPNIPKEYDIIFDLGGHIDKRAIEALRQSDIVLIPTVNDYINLQVTIDAINEIQAHNKKIFIIANKILKNDFEEIKKVMSQFYNFPVFELKRSRVFSNIFQEKKSIEQIVQSGGLKAYNYRLINEQFNYLIGTLRGLEA